MKKYLSQFFKHKLCLKIFFATLSLIGILTANYTLYAQNSNIAEAWDPNGYGFYIKKVVSDTSICTGVTFSYTIYFSFPAGTQYAKITDQIPPALNFHSIAVTNACGTPSVTAPTPGTNGTVTAVWSSLPSTGCSGSMTIVVSFPNGVTCNGITARNNVCLDAIYQTAIGLQDIKFCTQYVSTKAQAINPWQIQKQVLYGTWQGGNCPWKIANDTVTYQICVFKNNPAQCGVYGQLNLVNGVVTDVLPAGAQFISSSIPVNLSGNTITWNVGNLSSTVPYNTVCCDIKVYYPASQYPTGSQITNTATLTGLLGSPNNPCPQFSLSSSICFEKVLPPPPTTTASLFKWGSTNGQPGCGGTYWIQFCNTGNTPLSAGSVVIRDTLPSTLTLTSATGYSNLTVNTTGNIITANLNQTLQPGNCTYITINYTISQSAVANSTITNCAYAYITGLSPLSSCWSFVVNAPSPKPCILKEICSPQSSYTLGQIIRIRLRIQNTGGQAISSSSITDNLDPNFQYFGNPMFYISTAWNTPCNPTIGSGNVTTWNPTPNLTVSGQSVSITNVNIPATCQSLFWDGCGMYGNGNVPYYWIEFDVKIRDTAGLGNIPNSFTISGGNLTQPTTSNTVLALTTGNIGFSLQKDVASDTTQWASSLTLSPGSNFFYKLKMQIASGSVPLRNVTFVDLLPLDNGTNDNRILPQPCQTRGSQFDITYQSIVLSSPSSNLYRNTTSQASANGISLIPLFPTSCGTSTSWNATSPLVGDKNIGIFFPTAVGASSSPYTVLEVKSSPNALPGQVACNSFAAGGTVRHYLNTTISSDVPVGPLESQNVCISIDSSMRCYNVNESVVTLLGPTPHGCKYEITVGFTNPTTSQLVGCVSSPQGTITPNTFNIPVGVSSQVFTFIDTPPQDNSVCLILGIMDNADECTPCDTVCVKIPACAQNDECCPKFDRVQIICKDKDNAGNQMYSITANVSMPNKNCLPATLMLSSPDGAFSPSVFTLTSLNTSIGSTFTDIPPIQSSITIKYVIVKNGAVLCTDSVKIKLPQCAEPIDNCCNDWTRDIMSNTQWFTSGMVVINGNASASVPLRKFSATIVSAQRKAVPNIIGNPPGVWAHIYGDFTSGTVFNPSGYLSMLSPFSRELIWGDSCTMQPTPSNFTFKALFPPPPGIKQRDTLKFSVRYSYTTCDCRTCDTIITYTIVRRNILINPWDIVEVNPKGTGIQFYLQQVQTSAKDTTNQITLSAIEIHPIDSKDRLKSSKIIGSRENIDVIDTTSDGGIVVLIGAIGKNEPLQILIDGNVTHGISVRYHFCERNSEGEDCSGIEEREYPINLGLGESSLTIVKEEGIVDNIRTFSLAILNEGKTTLSGVKLRLTPQPQDDGTIPSILAIGSPTSPELTIKNYQNVQSGIEPQSNTEYEFSEDIVEPNNAIKPVYITISGIAKQNGTETVTLNYTLIDRNSQEVGSGTVVLEGAISGIIQEPNDEGSISSMNPQINAIIPNPATESATVSIWSPRVLNSSNLEVYDMRGELIKSISLQTIPKGTSAIKLDLSNYSSGSYLLILKTHLGTAQKSLIIIK